MKNVVFQKREKPHALHIQKYGIPRNYQTALVGNAFSYIHNFYRFCLDLYICDNVPVYFKQIAKHMKPIK